MPAKPPPQVDPQTPFPGGNPGPNIPGGGPVFGDTDLHPTPTGMGQPTGWWTSWGPSRPRPQTPERPLEPGYGRTPWWYNPGGTGVSPWPGDPANPFDIDQPGVTPVVPGNDRPRGGGGGGNVGFPFFDPNNPYGPTPDVLTGQGFLPWAPIIPGGMGMWSGAQGGPGGGGGYYPPGGFGGGVGPVAPGVPGNPLGGGMSAFQTYLSAIPVMDAARDSQISQAMATSGLTGNRFSSSAQKTAGQIGAQTALAQNQLLANLLHDETGRTLDRALQATGMGLSNEQFRNELALRARMGDRDAMLQAAQLGIGLGSAQEQAMQDRIRMLQGFGGAEQGRQDQFARMGLDQFNQDRLGPIPMILQALSGSSGSGGGGGQTSTGGSPGVMDYAIPIITALIMSSDARLKKNIRPIATVPVNVYEWDWKDGSGHSAGVLAQEVEEYLPGAVLTDPVSGYKSVNYTALLERMAA